eukprot:4696380-Pyramimonas_sp.AAC.1
MQFPVAPREVGRGGERRISSPGTFTFFAGGSRTRAASPTHEDADYMSSPSVLLHILRTVL